MANSGRSVNGERAVPHFPQAQRAEVVRHLRTIATQFLKERATFEDVIEACKLTLELRERV